MKIEQEIKQSKFRNEYQKLFVNLIFTSKWLEVQASVFLKKFDLTQQQFNILRILRGQYPKPSPVKLLVERMIDKQCDASRMVERLRLKGLVDRNECKSNRRQVDLMITDKGLALLDDIDLVQEQMDELLINLTPVEAGKMNDMLDKIRG